VTSVSRFCWEALVLTADDAPLEDLRDLGCLMSRATLIAFCFSGDDPALTILGVSCSSLAAFGMFGVD